MALAFWGLEWRVWGLGVEASVRVVLSTGAMTAEASSLGDLLPLRHHPAVLR